MATCLKCYHPMNQTEAICPHCGEDYLDVQPGRWHVLLHQSSLKDLFYLVTVMGIFFALLRWLIPFHTSLLFRFLVIIAFGSYALLLGERAPFWSRVFSLVAILGFLYYPLLAVLAFAWWLLRNFLAV